MINISAIGRSKAKPWFMTPKRKAHLAKMRAMRKDSIHNKPVLIDEMDNELDRLGTQVSYG